jgi:hypothetical protein
VSVAAGEPIDTVTVALPDAVSATSHEVTVQEVTVQAV